MRPQLNPISSQNNFNTFKTPGLYYDIFDGNPIPNAPINSLNFRSTEIGSAGRYSQIAMPFDYDKMFFRRQRNNDFSPWLEVVHSGNINTLIQPALSTKQDKLTFPSENDYDGWRLVSNHNISRRLISDDKLQVAGVFKFSEW